VISGIIHPDQGKVIINGKIAPILSLGAGLEPELTGYDNIKLVCILMGISTSQIHSSIEKIAAFSELSKDELSMQVKRYSTGMTARLSFSIAIAADPDILIIDEVLAVGDVGFQEKCYHRINDIKKNGATIVFVSHSMGDVMQICDHACVINNGEIVFNGLVNEACEKYQQQFHS
jgi:ABC-type polysaccharide/polyol phosphate transport system ATPase subunit